MVVAWPTFKETLGGVGRHLQLDIGLRRRRRVGKKSRRVRREGDTLDYRLMVTIDCQEICFLPCLHRAQVSVKSRFTPISYSRSSCLSWSWNFYPLNLARIVSNSIWRESRLYLRQILDRQSGRIDRRVECIPTRLDHRFLATSPRNDINRIKTKHVRASWSALFEPVKKTLLWRVVSGRDRDFRSTGRGNEK